VTLFDLAPKETPSTLFGRESELAALCRLVRAHRWAVVLGPRMVGKTSLVKAARARLGIPGAYVSLWGINSLQGLVDGLIHGLNEQPSLRARLTRGLGRVESIAAGPAGLSVSAPRRPQKTAWDLLELMGAEQKAYLLVLDEVQELSPVSGRLLKLLANVHNSRPNLVFVFTGSRVGLVRTLLEPTADSPLFGRAPVAITLGPFDRDVAESFLRAGAREAATRLSDEEVRVALGGPLDGTPGWLTLFGNNLTVRGLPASQALAETIQDGKRVAESELLSFLSNHDPRLYWPALKALALGSSWGAVRSAVEQNTSRVVNDATVQRILKTLEAAAIARNVEGRYELIDPMVRTYVSEAGSEPKRRFESSIGGTTPGRPSRTPRGPTSRHS
jgi:uncharacterized protein